MTREPDDDAQDRGGSRALAVLLGLCILGLLAALALSFMDNRSTERRLLTLEEYVEGRGEYRDREADRLEAYVDRVVCDILGEFPADDARADRLRVRYDCPIPSESAEGVP